MAWRFACACYVVSRNPWICEKYIDIGGMFMSTNLAPSGGWLRGEVVVSNEVIVLGYKLDLLKNSLDIAHIVNLNQICPMKVFGRKIFENFPIYYPANLFKTLLRHFNV